MRNIHSIPGCPARRGAFRAAAILSLAFLPDAVFGVNEPVLIGRVRSVTFSGGGYTHLTDDAGNAYNIPQWRLDVPVVGPPYLYNRSVSYVKATIPEIAATFEVTGLLENDNMVTISATGTDGIDLPPKAVPVNNGVAAYPVTPAEGAWPDTIKFYDRHPELSDDPPPFVLHWTVAQGTRSFEEPTLHQVYVTLTAPTTTRREETLFYLACNGNTTGMNVAGHGLTAAIFEKFKKKTWDPANPLVPIDPMMHPIDPETGDENSNVTLLFNLSASPNILASHHGVCQNWSKLFVDVLKVHGMDGAIHGVTAASVHMVPPPDGTITSRYWYVEDQKKNSLGTAFFDDGAESNGPLCKGQGGANPRVSWQGHIISSAYGYYYDPSYGIGPCATAADYEKEAVAGYGVAWEDGGIPDSEAWDNPGNSSSLTYDPPK